MSKKAITNIYGQEMNYYHKANPYNERKARKSSEALARKAMEATANGMTYGKYTAGIQELRTPEENVTVIGYLKGMNWATNGKRVAIGAAS